MPNCIMLWNIQTQKRFISVLQFSMCSSQTLTDGVCPVNKGLATYDRRIHKYNVDIESHFTQQSSIKKFNEATVHQRCGFTATFLVEWSTLVDYYIGTISVRGQFCCWTNRSRCIQKKKPTDNPDVIDTHLISNL